MASDVLRDLFVRIGVEVDKKQWSQFDKSVARAKSGLLDIAKGTAILGGAAWGAKKFVDSMAEVGDAAEETASKVGVTVAELQTLEKMGELNGISAEGVATGLKFLSKNAYEASRGSKELGAAFGAIGIGLKDSDGNLKSTGTLMSEVADKFAGMQDGAQKTNLAMKLFGRSGADLIPTLNAGSAGIEAMRQELSDMGLLLTDEEAKAMSEYRDDSIKLNWALKGLAMTLGKIVMPLMRDMVKTLREKMKPAMEWMKENTDKVKFAVKALAVAFAAIGIGFIIAGFIKLALAVAGLATAFGAMGLAGLAAFAKVIAIPLFLAAGFYAVYLVIQDIWKALTDPTAITEFGNILKYWKTEFEAFVRTIEELFGLLGWQKKQSNVEIQQSLAAQGKFNPALDAMGTTGAPMVGGVSRSITLQVGAINIDAKGADSAEISNNIVTKMTEQINSARRGLVSGGIGGY